MSPAYHLLSCVHLLQDQKLHLETTADAQTHEACTMPGEVASHSGYPLSANLYQYERRVLL